MGNSQTHPGMIVLNEVMKPLGLSPNKLACELHITTQRIYEIINGRRGITADTALRLARFLDTNPELWLDLQRNYELSLAQEKWASVESEVRPLHPSRRKLIKKINIDIKGVEERQAERDRQRQEEVSKLNESQKCIYELLSDKPIHFDKLLEESKLHVGTLSSELTMLELDGLVNRSIGDWYTRSD